MIKKIGAQLSEKSSVSVLLCIKKNFFNSHPEILPGVQLIYRKKLPP